MERKHRWLRSSLPFAVVAALGAGAAGGITLDETLNPREKTDPVVKAAAICPANTDLIMKADHKLLSKAAVQLACEDTSGQLEPPVAGYPGIKNLTPGLRTAPTTSLYIAYKPEDGGGKPQINSLSGDGPYDTLQLVGASAIVDVSLKEP